MKLGIANRLSVFDVDLADTLDVTPRYADVAYLLQMREDAGDDLAQDWVDAINDYDSRESHIQSATDRAWDKVA